MSSVLATKRYQTHSRGYLLVVLSPLTTSLTPLFQQAACDIDIQHRFTVHGYKRQTHRHTNSRDLTTTATTKQP